MCACETATAYIGVGSNLDDPVSKVRAALRALDDLPATRVTARSSLYRTDPVGYADQPQFINAVARIETALAPEDLLQALLGIEARYGRVRSMRNAPRTLDLDVLLYEDRLLHTPMLTIPHPRMHERAFVLAPLAEIAPGVVVPGRGRAAELLDAVTCRGVEKIGSA